MAKTSDKADNTAVQKKAATVKAKPTAETKSAEVNTVIYVGPLVRGTILTPMTIFEDGIPKDYREHPTFKHLFVAPERLDQARREIGRKGSLRNTYYNRAIAESQKKGSE